MVGLLILFNIHTVIIGTMLNFNGGNNGHGMCTQTFRVYSQFASKVAVFLLFQMG